MTVIPLADGTYEANCERCAWSFSLSSEELLGKLIKQHDERHAEPDRLATSLERAAALEPRDFRDGHRHTALCTQESCPGATRYFCVGPCIPRGNLAGCDGHPIPSRAMLVGASAAMRGR